jgi:hypothetical protein
MNFLTLGLMALIYTNDGSVAQFGHVDSYPNKASNQIERVITQDELDLLVSFGGQAKLVGDVFVYAPFVEPPTPFPNGIISEGRIVAQGVDIEATSPDTGYILVDTSTNKWLVTIADGEVIAVQISASPEISMEQRRIVLDAERVKRRALRGQLKAVRTNLNSVVFSDFPAAERQHMRTVVDAVQELRKVLRDVVKGSD